MLSWFYQIKFVKMKAKVYFCKVGTGKHDRNEGKPVNEGDAPPPSKDVYKRQRWRLLILKDCPLRESIIGAAAGGIGHPGLAIGI